DVLVTHLADAILARRQIALFADYDVDGATSAAVVWRTLKSFGVEARIMVPDRVSDGYGPSVPLMERLVAGGAEVVVTLDCGAGAVEPVAAAKGLGATVLVIDHHPVDTIAPAHAVVNPNRADDLSGLGDCAAVGVAFVVMVALAREMRRRGVDEATQPDLMALLDCVALGTVADVVPLTGLNRAFVRAGLKTLRRRGNRGLTALTEAARVGGPVDAGHLGFALGPRINAGGRIGDGGLGAKLLTTDDDAEAQRIASLLDQLNGERRTMERRALEEAVAMADETAPVIVVAGPWHPGVVGLVASRLKDRFRRPALAIGLGNQEAGSGDGRNGVGIGSGRSIPGVDLGAAVRQAASDGLLLKGGGHAMAAGLTVAAENLDAVTRFLTHALGADVELARAADRLSVDGTVGLAALDEDLAQLLAGHGPWGAGRPKPRFALEAVVLDSAQAVGSGDTLRLSLRGLCGTRRQAMAFRASGDLGALLRGGVGDALHLVVELSHSTYRGRTRADIVVVDGARARASARRAA
ncbi:MAG: single-stranded-DNA-specific exonuclease RecJ, partial [Pseudomonadota bacterium]